MIAEIERPVIATSEIRRMCRNIADHRKDGLVIDFARLAGVHYGRAVEHFSRLEGNAIPSHNNKVLFLEAADLWCRNLFAVPRASIGETRDPRVILDHVMQPWYEAMELDDPSTYRMPRQAPPPKYIGSEEDATSLCLGIAACLDITPIQLRFGMRGEDPERVWGRAYVDDKWYDTAVMEPGFVLGDRPKYGKVEEVDVPL